MADIRVRRYQDGDASGIVEIVKKDVLAENIKDYSREAIDHLIETHNEELIERRAKWCHVYVLTDEDKIIGVGMIGPYWDSLTESSFFTIFIDPSYKGQGLGRKIIETLMEDEYYKRADRVEIPASITAVEFYKHMGWKFKRTDKVLGNIVDNEGIYRMERFKNNDDNKLYLYNMRPYIDNEYHDYKEFIYQVKKQAYQRYVEECWGAWIEDEQRRYYENFINNVYKDTWIIQLDGVDIGFYNGATLEDGSYEIGNICIIPEYQGRGIGTDVLNDVIKLHENQDIHIQYFKQNPVGKLYERLGFVPSGETEFHYQMVRPKVKELEK